MRHVAVIGAGAFGGWTALALRRRGARVTLVDAWGPGHPRTSSGGETRVIRAAYGSHGHYTRMAARAMELWRRYDTAHDAGLLHLSGVLWLIRSDDGFAAASMAELPAAGLRIEEIAPGDAAVRYPQIALEDVSMVLWEPDAGYLFASRACRHVVDRFLAEGGAYAQAAVKAPVGFDGDPIARVELERGEPLAADAFVFACGPWLGRLFPEVVGDRISVTRQEVCFFGTPAGDTRFHDPALPVWLDYGDRVMYGIPARGGHGFKIADDSPGSPFDPTSGSREVSRAGVAAVRTFLAHRFPALADAPLIGSEVCQYETTPDAHFIIDRHPGASNVWITGGGSGHGFKMGPVVGEVVAALVLDGETPEPQYALGRFASAPAAGWQPKWS